jgi:Flp pilus assembly protein TadD
MDNPFVQHAEMQLLRGAPDQALNAARMGLTVFPDSHELLSIAATCAERVGELEFAVTCWRHLLELDPATATAGNSLGLLLERLQRPDEAEAAFRQALSILPEDATLHANLGLLLENTGRLDEAERCLRHALQRAPESAEIHSNLAGLLARIDQVVEAEALYRRAIALKPEFAVAHSNLGVLYAVLERNTEAEGAFRNALQLEPDNLQGRMNLAQLLLALGRWPEAWPLYESRSQVYAGAGTGPAAVPPPCPCWQGEALAGKSIVVLPEQGFGDEIQFARYLPWLKAQGPARLTLVCRPRQKALLQTLAGPDAVLALDEVGPALAGHDYWTFLLSLPLHAGSTLEHLPPGPPYLFPDPVRIERLVPQLTGEGLRVGLVWRGNPGHTNDAERSLPGLQTLAPLWAVPGVRFFSLQKGAQESVTPPPGQPLFDLAPLLGDMADSAAALSQLDLLIAVDTSMVHLAGALGIPCWVLLPRYKTDWRWLQGRDDSPWYPATRLFRQQRRGDWSAPVAVLADALREFAAARRVG